MIKCIFCTVEIVYWRKKWWHIDSALLFNYGSTDYTLEISKLSTSYQIGTKKDCRKPKPGGE